MDLSHQVRYETRRLKEDPAKGLPPRIYIDLFAPNWRWIPRNRLPWMMVCCVSCAWANSLMMSYDRHRPDDLGEHSAVLLAGDPYRLVIDVQGHKNAEAVATVDKSKKEQRHCRKKESSFLLREFARLFWIRDTAARIPEPLVSGELQKRTLFSLSRKNWRENSNKRWEWRWF